MHPSFFFIKYLLVALPDGSDDIINENLKVNGMSSAPSELIDTIREEVKSIPENFEPWNKQNKDSNKWLHKQKIDTIVHQDEYVRQIDDLIINRPRDREVLERMLLTNMGPREICYKLSKMDINIPDPTISAYKHYFWNTDIMSMSQWADYFQKDDSNRVSGSKTSYAIALNAGPEAAVLRLGIKQQLDSKKIMQEVQRELYTTFLETKTLPLSDKKVAMLTDLARGLAKVDERVQAGDSALLDTLKKFEKFKIITPQDNMKKIADLSGKGTTSYKKERR
jgi:hypothetical protein